MRKMRPDKYEKIPLSKLRQWRNELEVRINDLEASISEIEKGPRREIDIAYEHTGDSALIRCSIRVFGREAYNLQLWKEQTVRELLTHPTIMPIYWIVLSILIIGVDHLTGPYLQFPILFLIPVVLAAVYNGRWWGVGLAVGMPLIRCFLEIQLMPWAVTQEIVNTGVRMAVLAGFAVLVDRTARQTRALMQEVKTLRGIVPMCSYCKKIRKEDDTWEVLEKYITEHSEARLSHGLCPDCFTEQLQAVRSYKAT
jgi:hypothetical protein